MEEEKKRAAAAHQERIIRENEELRKLKEKEAVRQQEHQSRQADTTLNKTVTLDQSQVRCTHVDTLIYFLSSINRLVVYLHTT